MCAAPMDGDPYSLGREQVTDTAARPLPPVGPVRLIGTHRSPAALSRRSYLLADVSETLGAKVGDVVWLCSTRVDDDGEVAVASVKNPEGRRAYVDASCVERLVSVGEECECGTSPMTYEGPEPTCSVHGRDSLPAPAPATGDALTYEELVADLTITNVIWAETAWRISRHPVAPPSIAEMSPLALRLACAAGQVTRIEDPRVEVAAQALWDRTSATGKPLRELSTKAREALLADARAVLAALDAMTDQP